MAYGTQDFAMKRLRGLQTYTSLSVPWAWASLVQAAKYIWVHFDVLQNNTFRIVKHNTQSFIRRKEVTTEIST